MVIIAKLGTNVRGVVRDVVDGDHGISYFYSEVRIGSSHTLNTVDGVLQLGDIQSERPIVEALGGNSCLDPILLHQREGISLHYLS